MSAVSSAAGAAAAQVQSQLASTGLQQSIQTDQQTTANLVQALESSQARIDSANASPPPTLDGTGGTIDYSV